MGLFILRRLGVMLLTALCLTFIVFWLTNLYPNLEKLAKTQGNFRMSDEAVASYLDKNGYLQPMPVKFGQWLGVLPGWTYEADGVVTGRCFPADTPEAERASFCGVLQGDWGTSTVFKDEVGTIVSTRLALTGKLMFAVMLDNFSDDEIQKLLGEFGVELGFAGQVFEPGDLLFFTGRIGWRKVVFGLEHAHGLGVFEALSERVDKDGIQPVNAGAVLVQDLCGALCGVGHGAS